MTHRRWRGAPLRGGSASTRPATGWLLAVALAFALAGLAGSSGLGRTAAASAAASRDGPHPVAALDAAVTSSTAAAAATSTHPQRPLTAADLAPVALTVLLLGLAVVRTVAATRPAVAPATLPWRRGPPHRCPPR